MRLTLRLASLALSLVVIGCAPDDPADAAGPRPVAPPGEGLTATGSFARPALSGANSAMYVTLTNSKAAADTLLSAEVAAAARVELHETFESGEGMRGMRELTGGVPLAPTDVVALEPGGKHVMLMGLTEDLTTGDTLSATLVFSSGERLEVEAPVQ
jgi:copper(I)-binding protein